MKQGHHDYATLIGPPLDYNTFFHIKAPYNKKDA